MFNCEHCKYQITSIRIMEIHYSTFHNKEAKYICDVCGHQSLQKERLARHKIIKHDGAKYSCKYQTTLDGNLTEQKGAADEEIKYPCGQCGKHFTSSSILAQHKRAVHEGVKYPCRQCNYQATSKSNFARH